MTSRKNIRSQNGNLFDEVLEHIKREVFETLVEHPGLKVQRILSQGQTTDWQKADTNEWVVLLAGDAKLLFEKDNREVRMKPGDYVSIPAGCRHRVNWTDPQQKSVWLAVHYPAARRPRPCSMGESAGFHKKERV